MDITFTQKYHDITFTVSGGISTGSPPARVSQEFDNTYLTNNILTHTHGFGRLPTSIQVYNPSGELVSADVSATTDQVFVNFGGVITGSPWTLVMA